MPIEARIYERGSYVPQNRVRIPEGGNYTLPGVFVGDNERILVHSCPSENLREGTVASLYVIGDDQKSLRGGYTDDVLRRGWHSSLGVNGSVTMSAVDANGFEQRVEIGHSSFEEPTNRQVAGVFLAVLAVEAALHADKLYQYLIDR